MGSLTETAHRIASGRSTSEAETAAALDRIEQSQPRLNAFTVVAREQAMQQARAADGGGSRGVLHGVPVAVKDLFDVAGWETSACSRMYAGRIATEDAPVVAALRAAGAVIVGKTNMHELAFGATNDVSSFGPANNPWDPSRMTGGSSGGSAAAVAAGLVPLALGTDTGGSVRIPAALCGVTGLKTTHGLISLTGVVPLALSMDTVGPLTGDALDAALAMKALTGLEIAWRDDLTGVTVGVAGNRSFDMIDSAVDAAVRDAIRVLEQAGAHVMDTALPDAEQARDTWADIALSEFLDSHPNLDDDLLSEDLRFLAAAARQVGDGDLRAARAAMAESGAAWERSFASVDVIAMPSTPVGAPPHFATSVEIDGAQVAVHGGLLSAKTRQVNVAGVPAISVPCGLDRGGMPVGLQLAGAHGSENLLLAIAHVYQRRSEFHRARPPGVA